MTEVDSRRRPSLGKFEVRTVVELLTLSLNLIAQIRNTTHLMSMKKYAQFLLALLENFDRIQILLSDQWPDKQAQLVRILRYVVTEQDDHRLAALVNRIYRSFAGTPAEAMVGHLYQQALRVEIATNLADRSMERPRDKQKSVVAVTTEGTIGAAQISSAGESEAALKQAARKLVRSIEFDCEGEERHLDQEDNEHHRGPSAPMPQEMKKRINAWISERTAVPTEPLTLGKRYTLNLGVGTPIAASLLSDENANIPEKDLKGGGLQTEWKICTSAFELSSDDPEVTLSATPSLAPNLWTATFSLWVPEEGESDIRQIRIVPRSGENCRLEVLIYAVRAGASELYRQFRLALSVDNIKTTGTNVTGSPVQDDLIFAPSSHMNLRTTHEWTTPPGRLAIAVLPGMQKAYVTGDLPTRQVNDLADWFAQQDVVTGPIDLVRDAAEKFRGKWQQYLNEINAQDLEQRLATFTPTYDWANWRSRADSQHANGWAKASISSELRDLAIYGHELYQVAFPPDQPLRGWLDSMQPGSRVDFTWKADAPGSGNVPNVPWGMMYQPDPPAPGEPVDPMGFLALRFRLGYWGYRGVSDASKALGAMTQAYQSYCLYWGNHPNDETGGEASWQRQKFKSWQNQVFSPQIPGSPNARAEVLQALSTPQLSPTSVLYFFCQAAVGDGNKPVLQFGPTSGITDVLQTTDLLTGKSLLDQPLVFANACTTSFADPYIANLLQQSLFRRGCRGFLGTETKVPIQLASRFAVTFFNFFYRKVDPAPMAAGEALAQTRLFLLTEYANIGGIFYAYLNQYELYMADEAEVQALRR